MTEGLAEGVHTLAGRYEIGDLIGRGGMSDVYAGTDTRLGREVAIKLLRAQLAEDPQFRARFRREAQDAAKMTHPTIVRILDAGEESTADGGLVPFIVMERIEGRLLSDLVREGPLDPAEAVRIVEQVLVALEYSHRAGVIHRDIKPSNIMIAAGGQVKVMDFGIARAVSESAATLAETSQVVGTAQYFSPEQARGDQVDARTDLYSTGVVLFELLTGRPPFLGDNPVGIAYQHLNAEPPLPSTIRPGIPPALDAVVLRSLAKEPERRYPDATVFRSDLAAALTGRFDPRSAAARPDAFAATLFGSQDAAREAVARQVTSEVDDRARRTQSGPPVLWIWTGIAVLIAIVIAVGYWIVTLQPANIVRDLTVVVPAVAGQPFDEVQQQLTELDLKVTEVLQPDETVAEGIVISTNPPAGRSMERGEEIKVFVSGGKAEILVPDVSRLSRSAATSTLEEQGFVLGEITEMTSPDVPKGSVIEADYLGMTTAGGRVTAPRGATIDLLVSNGLVSIPDLEGRTMQDAQSAFQRLGLDLEIEIDTSCSGLTVQKQSIQGDKPQGSAITITVCGGQPPQPDEESSEE